MPKFTLLKVYVRARNRLVVSIVAAVEEGCLSYALGFEAKAAKNMCIDKCQRDEIDNLMKVAQELIVLDKLISTANRNYDYWLNYTTPQGAVCDTNITHARKEANCLHAERRALIAKF